MLTTETWILIGTTAILSSAYYLFSTIARKRRPGEPPIVKGSFLLGSAGDFSRHAVQFLHDAHKSYGDVFTMRLLNQHITVIMDPQSYEAVSREKNFDFDPIQKQVNKNVFSYFLIEPKKMLMETTKTVKGDMMLQALDRYVDNLDISYKRIASSSSSSNGSSNGSSARNDISSGRNSSAVNGQQSMTLMQDGKKWESDGLRHFASRTIFDAIFNTIFGRDDEHKFSSALAFENFETFHKYFNYLWLGFPIALFPKAVKAQKEMLCMPESEEMLGRCDLSTYMRKAVEFMQEHGQSEMDMKGHNLVYLHVNYNTFRLAFWVLNNLIENKAALEALNGEINQVIESRKNKETNMLKLTVKDLENMTVLDSIVQETTRIASGVFMVRYVTDDTTFTTDAGEDFLIRKGDRVALYPPALHKDPEIFEDPLTFKYDRFIDAKFYKSGKEVKHPVMGFGTICPGKRYALLQLKWYILTTVTRFEMRMQPGQHAEYDTSYYGHEILPPVGDIQIEFHAKDNYPQLSFSNNNSSCDNQQN